MEKTNTQKTSSHNPKLAAPTYSLYAKLVSCRWESVVLLCNWAHEILRYWDIGGAMQPCVNDHITPMREHLGIVDSNNKEIRICLCTKSFISLRQNK